MKSDGGSAFPRALPKGEFSPDDCLQIIEAHAGMTLRDYFAAAALQAMHGGAAEIFTASLVPPERASPGEERAYVKQRIAALAGAVYAIADAMLAERSKA